MGPSPVVDQEFGEILAPADFAKEGGLRHIRGFRDGFGRSKIDLRSSRDDVKKPVGELEIINEKVQRYTKLLGGTATIEKRVIQILRWMEANPAASFPEGLVYDWLIRRNVYFIYQPSALGGRQSSGGLVPDFVVIQGAYKAVWLIQGTYWHSKDRIENAGRDDDARARLTGARVYGYVIDDVLEIWEHVLYRFENRYGTVLERALSGIEYPS